jgi:hypothetical protein
MPAAGADADRPTVAGQPFDLCQGHNIGSLSRKSVRIILN